MQFLPACIFHAPLIIFLNEIFKNLTEITLKKSIINTSANGKNIYTGFINFFANVPIVRPCTRMENKTTM